jgi:hypothetical protein
MFAKRRPGSGAAEAAWSDEAVLRYLASIPNRQADHDAIFLSRSSSRLSFQRAPVMPRPLRGCRFPDYALVAPEFPKFASNYPTISPDGEHPTVDAVRLGRKSERPRSSPQLKIP